MDAPTHETATLPPAKAPRRLTLDAVYLAAALAITAAIPLLSAIPPHDLWWHLAVGRAIAHDGRIPTVDQFSYTQAGRPFFDQSWLAQLLLYGLYQLGGLPLLLLAQAVVMVVTYGLLLWMAARLSGNTRLSTALLLLAIEPNSYTNWNVRPQGYAFPLFAGFLVILTGYRLRWWRRLWPLVPLMALWVNLHGSFVLGLGLIGGVLVSEALRRYAGDTAALSGAEWRRLAGWGALSALAVLANPRGPAVLAYVRNLVGSKTVTALVSEWGSPTVKDLAGKLFFLLVVGVFVSLISARRRPCPTELALLLLFFWLALDAERNIVWFGMVALAPLACALASHREGLLGRDPGHPAANAALVAMLGLAVVFSLPWLRPLLKLPPQMAGFTTPDTPTAAVAHLRTLPPERRPRRLFHSDGFGSYLIWAAPEQRVFIDTRFELYPYAQVEDVRCLNRGYDVEERLRKYAFDGLLLDCKRQKELLRRAIGSGRWRVTYRDAAAVLLLPAGR